MFDLFGNETKATEETKDTEVVDNEKVSLRQEELDIAKERVETGEVTLGKEIVEEHKSVDVPVMHEEVVIERHTIDAEPTEDAITAESETIHIPVSEEQVEVGKHTMVTGEVTAHKRAVEETKHIEETLMKEEARIESSGDANIVASEDPDQIR